MLLQEILQENNLFNWIETQFKIKVLANNCRHSLHENQRVSKQDYTEGFGWDVSWRAASLERLVSSQLLVAMHQKLIAWFTTECRCK